MIVRRLNPTRPRWEGHFNEFDDIRRDMRRFLDAFSGNGLAGSVAGVFPLMNVSEDRDGFYVRAELPGVAAEDLSISAVNRTLTVSGKRQTPPEEGVSYHRRERTEGGFSRSVTMPSEFDNERVDARLVNGLLEVTLPKPEKMKPRQISVKTS